MSACAVAGAGHRISSAPRTASAMSSVTPRQHHLMASLEILHQDAAIGVAMRGNRLHVAPPQPHLVPGQGQIAGRRERPVSSA